jgi:hypothetical protein
MHRLRVFENGVLGEIFECERATDRRMEGTE